MKSFLPSFLRGRRRGMALVIVISALALISVLVVAIFSVTRTEYKATRSFVSARSAKQLGDISVAVVQAQIQQSHNPPAPPAEGERKVHATQPGMVRVYNVVGTFQKALKLYSSSEMVVPGPSEADIFTSAPVPADWHTQKARYVDLNEPAIRPSRTPGGYALYFPIIDPRAATNITSGGTTSPAIEGFSYSKKGEAVGSGGGTSFSQVVTPSDAGGNVNELRLPMPVEWLYVLQDGTLGTLTAENTFVSADGATAPSVSNPIVGRVAFWTDDESSKVNINTAAEPTFFASPYFYHQRDYKWANNPPSTGEYQRYPGHPATVALSTIFAPGVNLDPYSRGANGKTENIVTIKEAIYDLAPKIKGGGSQSGTLAFGQDDFSSSVDLGFNNFITISRDDNPITPERERLYASVDELIFKEGNYDSKTGRPSARFTVSGQALQAYDQSTIERSRFFLTAHSRAPEFTNYGTPRITMWPIADESRGQERRTSFDNMIALCSNIRPPSTAGETVSNADHTYYFRRAQAHHSTHDVTGSSSLGQSTTLTRNSSLLNYLYQQINGMKFPATSSSGTPSSTFANKYGAQNAAQMTIQFFDYIRSTNLYDGVLARQNNGVSGMNVNLTGGYTAFYNLRDAETNAFYTYTNQRATPGARGQLNIATIGGQGTGSDLASDNSRVYPGHGQVTPARWAGPSGVTPGAANGFQGFGRNITLSEIGFQAICTADGKNDTYAVNCNGVFSGGGSAPKATTSTVNVPPTGAAQDVLTPAYPVGSSRLGFRRWYSNFPPLTNYQGGILYGCKPTPGDKLHPANHPGYDPANWNMTLEPNKALTTSEKRIQVMLMLEMFCPMAGWTKLHPEWAISLNAEFIRNIKVNNVALFPTTKDVYIKSNENVYEDTDVYSLGGHAGPTAIAGGRSVPGWGLMGDDTDPYAQNAARSNSPTRYLPDAQNHEGLNNYGLVSQFVTVNRDAPLSFSFGSGNLVIKIYDSHKKVGQAGAEIQTINLNVAGFDAPVPALVYSGERRFGNGAAGALNAGEINACEWQDSAGRIRRRRALPAPHWWCFNRMGCLGRMTGQVNPSFNGSNNLYIQTPANDTTFDGANDQILHGRLDTNANLYSTSTSAAGGDGFSVIPPEVTTGCVDENNKSWTGSDVIRTFVPAVGDYRLIAAREVVPASMWKMHPTWEKVKSTMEPKFQPRRIHSFTTHWATTEPGAVFPSAAITTNPQFSQSVMQTQKLLSKVTYANSAGTEKAERYPDLPPGSDDWANAANSFGDFDNGIANSRDGAYVNKPDEGNFYMARFNRWSTSKLYRSGYFYDPWNNSDDWRTGIYMTPNRMISSPVMFGSLPTGVWDGGNVPTSARAASASLSGEGRPWQTLLFRPYVSANSTSGKANHPGNYNPRDHNLLDLFTMPIVEPYAISEPLSTAGKVNLNYQIMPFTNIRRATALHALLKGEFMTAIPNGDVVDAKTFKTQSESAWKSGQQADTFYSDMDNRYWHRRINVNATLGQFDQKFKMAATGSGNSGSFNGLFRSASQICEMHMIPLIEATSQGEGGVSGVNSLKPGEKDIPMSVDPSSPSSVASAMTAFWQAHSPTGDNTRERIYSNIYPRVTTRTNTFRVHLRAQVIRKARSTLPNTFDADKDAVVSEFRGSTLIERFIDPNNPADPIPDYGQVSSPLTQRSLDSFFRFRTLESKRFSP